MKATINNAIAREIADDVEPAARNIQKILNQRPSDISRDVWLLAVLIQGLSAVSYEKETPGTSKEPGADGLASTDEATTEGQ